MPIVSVNGYAHYTTAAQGNTKIAAAGSVTAGAGAFGAPGVVNQGERYAFPASAQREVFFYAKFSQPGNNAGLVALFSGGTSQVWMDVQPDGGATITSGEWAAFGDAIQGSRGSTVIGTVPAGTIQFGVHNSFKISVTHHPTTGTFKLVINSITVVDVTNVKTIGVSFPGNTWNPPRPTPPYSSSVLHFNNSGGWVGVNTAQATISHVIIADAIGDIVGTPRIGTLFPNGAGATSSWTPSAGSNWQNVDEVTPNDDTDYNSSDTVGHVDTYAMQDTPAGVGAISGLAVTVRVTKTDANSRTVAAVLRIGGVDYVHATAKGIPGGWAFLQWFWTLSPATGLAFTVAELDALEAGVKIIG